YSFSSSSCARGSRNGNGLRREHGDGHLGCRAPEHELEDLDHPLDDLADALALIEERGDPAEADVEDGLLQAGLQIRDLLAENAVGDAAAEERQHHADDDAADNPSEDAADENHEERRHGYPFSDGTPALDHPDQDRDD